MKKTLALLSILLLLTPVIGAKNPTEAVGIVERLRGRITTYPSYEIELNITMNIGGVVSNADVQIVDTESGSYLFSMSGAGIGARLFSDGKNVYFEDAKAKELTIYSVENESMMVRGLSNFKNIFKFQFEESKFDFEFLGEQDIKGVKCDGVRVTPKELEGDTYYFEITVDGSTNLPRILTVVEDGESQTIVINTISVVEYKVTGGEFTHESAKYADYELFDFR